jgi:hypothetical protein
MVTLTTLSVGQTVTVSNDRMISEKLISSCGKKEIIGYFQAFFPGRIKENYKRHQSG